MRCVPASYSSPGYISVYDWNRLKNNVLFIRNFDRYVEYGDYIAV